MRQVSESEYEALRNLEQAVRDFTTGITIVDEVKSGIDPSVLRAWIQAIDQVRKDSVKHQARKGK